MAEPTGWKKHLYRSLFLCFVVGAGIFIWSLYLPFHRPELLPLPQAHPATDGSYPELLIRYADSHSGAAPFTVSFARNAPSLLYAAPANQFEVNLSSGKFVVRQTDLFDAGDAPISLTRTYDSFDSSAQSYGLGTRQNYDVYPAGSRFPYTYIDLELEDGESVHFERISKGTGYTDAIYEHRATSSPEFFGARIRWNGNGWTLALPGGSTFLFPEAYFAKTFAQGAVTEMRSASGETVKVNRNHNGNIANVDSSSGHRMDFSYDDSGRIAEVRDDQGNDRRYRYDSNGRLVIVADANSMLQQFAYDGSLMTRIIDAAGSEVIAVMYNGGRVVALRLSSGDVYRFHYDTDSQNRVTRTVVLSPDGTTREFRFE
jgi:YD repeat-containing protein